MIRAKRVLMEGDPLSLNYYPSLKKVIQMADNIGIPSSEAERIFSAMGRTISLARNTLLVGRASDFVVIYQNSNITDNLNLNYVLNSWALKNKGNLTFHVQ